MNFIKWVKSIQTNHFPNPGKLLKILGKVSLQNYPGKGKGKETFQSFQRKQVSRYTKNLDYSFTSPWQHCATVAAATTTTWKKAPGLIKGPEAE